MLTWDELSGGYRVAASVNRADGVTPEEVDSSSDGRQLIPELTLRRDVRSAL